MFPRFVKHILGFIAAAGFVGALTVADVAQANPPARVVVHTPKIHVHINTPRARPIQPGSNYIWVDGYWTTTRGRAVWIAGHWKYQPLRCTAGHYTRQYGRTVWVAGHCY
ncbi:MAG: BcpO-related WXXGXW repeat protein [Proteobacteria bacterium]|jgi:hypothetical protein|nr:BcpO-related WXXGXW repeat protein [Pseudomonadota bacterium]